MVGYMAYQKYKIRKRSEKLEVEAEMGRSSGQLFHDISGHVTTLAGYVYYLKESMKESGESEENIKQLDDLLEFLIKYTRDAKQIVRDVYRKSDETIDLNSVLHRIVETQARMCFKKTEIEIVEKYPAGNIPVSARAFEAMFNVVRNACEAMEKSGVRKLNVSVEKENGFAVVRISDTGCGIPDKNKSKIFEYGFTTKSDGTGQGMTITKQAVEKSGGSIDVRSAAGQGTVIVMRFPVMVKPEKAEENPKVSTTT
jgi:signal transduction histidine kinase